MPLKTPIVQVTSRRVKEVINVLHQGNHIDTMTEMAFSTT